MMLNNIIDSIGNTPLIDLSKLTGINIYAKAEFLNPGGSIKDRIGKFMIEQAQRDGILRKGMTIMEPTSGNTGIGISLVGVQMGYKVKIVMPENMSEERKRIIKSFGAELILTPKEESVEGALNEVKRQIQANDNIFVPNQFSNINNPLIHYNTTAVEIFEDMSGDVDVFVSGLGSGGTLQGIGKYLKEKNPNCMIIAVEPKGVSALKGHSAGIHKIQGIGDGFIPDVLDVSLIDKVIEVSNEDAISTSRQLAKVCGCLVGVSAGANVWASMNIAKQYPDKKIVTILPDRAERYFSEGLL
ncbi:MAG: cysteine synthase A [Tepidibacter sp.]|uniref:cysteine synthase A n=1 Tax=Tepidibacter sp. TaxID=2529387 RepID=UPI0025E3814E|nr:cysteine synthase A [Tepidibacter sp.]MCT4509986.1 cysteine synthase A [Tepidibacter sp.]